MTREIMIANEFHQQQHQPQQQHSHISHKREIAENCNTNTTANDKTVVIDDTMLLILRKKRRAFYHHTCLLSVMAAFTIGLAMGIFFLPLIGLTSAKSSNTIADTINDNLTPTTNAVKQSKMHKYDFKSQYSRNYINRNQIHNGEQVKDGNANSFTPSTINNNNNNIKSKNNKNNNNKNPTIYSSVSFISDEKYSTENILNSLNNGEKVNNDYDGNDDATIQQYNRNNITDSNNMNNDTEMQQSHVEFTYEKENNETLRQIIDDDIYWGQMIENHIPIGFSKRDTEDWENYLQNNITEIIKIEQGCGRMQNRLVTFSDGVKACVRYRQNTDQIQGELFSFLLGRLLNITNLVPSTASVIDWDSRLWTQVKQHITESQWKTSRPVVFTKWIPDLEPSSIPEQFRPLERHMNKHDIWNITMDDGASAHKPSQILIERLKAKYGSNDNDPQQRRKKLMQKKKIIISERMYGKFIELAQWSDLIIFDYLIANLDRVVNNLYNFQWNADIMAAPAHNLARQTNSQLLVFLDNESGLLHGYRLLKKYEAYHSLLLDDLCVFRKATIDALKHLKDNNAGELLNEFFEQTASNKVRDVLPPLPEKSIKILSDRIDRVLQQVQKCQEMYSNR